MPQRPNFLLITTDQQRGDALGINGNDVLQTPNLDYLAASGVNFTRGYSTCPVCIPARRSLLTGLHPATHGVRKFQEGLELDPPFTLPGLLGKAGYQTQLIGKMHTFPQRKRFGFDNMIRSETENHRPDSPPMAVNDYVHWLQEKGISTPPQMHGISGNSRLSRPHYLDETLHHNTWLTNEAVRFMTETRDPSCPWFLHLSYYTPHPPFTPPAMYYERYARIAERMPRPVVGEWVPQWDRVPKGINPEDAFGPFEPEAIRNATVGYYGLINHVDDCIGRVLEAYYRYGSNRGGDPMYIGFTSDHGEMLGDHQLFRKSLPYEGSAHVPFFLSGRNVDLPKKASDALACLEDIAPTFLELAGVEPPAPMVSGPNGRSLAAALRGEACTPREVLHGECGGHGLDNHFLVTGRYKYIWLVDTDEEQVFDLETDPRETRDLSGDATLLAPLRERMAEHMTTRSHEVYDTRALRPLENQPPSHFWRGRRP